MQQFEEVGRVLQKLDFIKDQQGRLVKIYPFQLEDIFEQLDRDGIKQAPIRFVLKIKKEDCIGAVFRTICDQSGKRRFAGLAGAQQKNDFMPLSWVSIFGVRFLGKAMILSLLNAA